MDTRFLRSFLCIARTGSLSRAAAALNIVQPALSRQIRILEDELGTQLLVRHRRGIALTLAGEVLREHAAAIVAALDEARHAVSASGAEPSGAVSIGLPTSMFYVLAPGLVETFCRVYPRAFLQVFEAFGHVIESHLREGRVDAAVLISPKPMSGISLEPLLTENICLAGPPGAGLDMRKPVAASAIAEVPMIMFPAPNMVRMTIEALLARTGKALLPLVEIDGQPLTHELVRRGLGYTILPSCAVQAEIAAGRMSGAPIQGATIAWELGVNRARAGFPAVKALCDLVRSSIAAQIASGVWQVTSQAPAQRPRPQAKPTKRPQRAAR